MFHLSHRLSPACSTCPPSHTRYSLSDLDVERLRYVWCDYGMKLEREELCAYEPGERLIALPVRSEIN